AMALATIGLMASFVAVQRRATIATLRGRGASARQLLLGQASEGLLLCIPAALVGLLLADLLVRARPSVWSLVAAGVTVLAATALLVGAAAPNARRPLGTIEREEVVAARPSPRRLVFEAFVVVLAAAGVYLLRRRGLAGDSAAAQVGGFDPYLAAVPLLLGLALGLIVRRLFVFPVRLLAWQASFRRDLVPFLGFRRLARQSAVTSVPLLVLLLSVAVSVFSSVLLHTIEVGQKQSSWAVVGADYQVQSFLDIELPKELDLTTVPGVQAVAAAYHQADVTSGGSGGFPGTVSFLALDPDAYARVNAGRPVDPLPPALFARPSAGIGTPNHPIPALVSQFWNGNQPLRPGDTFALHLNDQDLTFQAVQVREQFAGLSLDSPFVVTQTSSVQAALAAIGPRGGTIKPNELFVRGPASAAAPIRAALKQAAPLATLVSRSEQYASVHDSPLIAGSANGFRLGLIVAIVYSALAVGLTLALSGRSRARDLAYLRTLGLSWRQAIWLTVAEQAPTTLLALILGIALGVVVVHLIAPGLDLSTFIGPGASGALVVDRWAITAIALALIVTVAAAVALVTVLLQRISLGSVLRLGEQ
ncbi:MAG TPA: FtsX-like permease family protein, partial [Thermomicrobiaceae bacterium]|nr:FtsX-like permease family protein [Thermomicrobiaceae bacterium]